MEPDPTDANLALKYIITHALAKEVVAATQAYTHVIADAGPSQWHTIDKMIENLCTTVQSPKLDESRVTTQLSTMSCGDVLTFFIRAQNAGVLFRRGRDVTVYASFELSPQAHSVITTKGKLLCSYPGPAIEIPNTVFDDSVFRSQLANFLVCMNEDKVDKDTGRSEANSLECHDTTNPRFITELLTGILRGVGRPATSVVRITKRIGDDVVISSNSPRPWRRSPLWLLIRVAIQTTLEVSAQQGHNSYKEFIIFFLTKVTEEAVRAGLSNDLIYFMSTKISRRLRKLGPLAPASLAEAALKICSRVRELLDERWKEIQDTQRASPPHDFSELDVKHDVQLSLSCSHEYLQQCLLNKETVPAAPFEPKHRFRGTLDDFLSCDGTFFTRAFRAEPVLTLYDVEVAVEQNIDAWVDGVTDSGEACVKLDVLADKYRSAAVETYSGDPERLSIMLLTIIELWIALDKVALHEVSILKDYDPEIRPTLLEHLLLRKVTSLRRLHQAHQYLSRRRSRSEPDSSVFSSTISEDTFAVRYYNLSPALQDLRGRIEEDAEEELRKKTGQLKEANKQHAQVKRESDRMHHTYDRAGTKRHSAECRKCSVESKLRRMKLEPYEWPLPDDELQAAVVIFELACPLTFGIWRTATFRFLSGLCPRPPRGKRPFLLSSYPPLKPYFVQHKRFHITLASDSRPLEHREIHIPATEDRIRVPTSLAFFGFDVWNGIPVENAFRNVDVKRYCTFELQDSSILQRYLNGTLHTSNDVLAGQADCPKDISIHEFLAFGHLRCGGSLQWFNILRELRDRSLTFRRPEVHLLIAQTIMQVGPISSTIKLKWHEELQQDPFGLALVDELETLVADVEANWLEGVTMNTVTLIISRLIAANPSEAVLERAVRLLHVVRTKTFSWVRELSDKVTRTPGDVELCGLLRDVAAICRSTFDVDPAIKHFINSAEDVEILLFCAILIHDNLPSRNSTLSAYSKLLLDRDRHLSLTLGNILYDAIPADLSERGIHLAVRRVWLGYRPGSEWKPLPPPNSRYFSCTTASTTNECSQTVHLNLLDGSLLVDGKSLGRLPSAIIQHALYNCLFGEQILDVLLGDVPGMDYATRGMVSGHRVYFSLRDKDLVIRAKRASAGDSEVMQLIPREKLENDFPAILLKGHIHWLNISTSIMEFRPLEKPWESSADSERWILDCTPGRYCMRKGCEYLVDVRSQSWAMVSSLLQPLDAPHHLLVTASPTDPDLPLSTLELAVALPRYGLSFYVDEDGELQSQNIRDMVYDENQSIGTLLGLVNQLVIRPKGRDNISSAELVPRCVLIPEGNVSFRTDGHHVRVEVDIRGPALQRVTYQTYRVDTELNTLTGNVSLTNKLYRAYLHALTSSGCNIDPLAGKSGTEEALRILRSASCLSIIKFQSRDVELLQLIASLCPIRTLHKRHRNMQLVHWLDLPARSQNHQLYLAAKDIKEHVEKLRLFHDSWETNGLKKLPSHDNHLFTRSSLRAHYLLPGETSEQLSIRNHDTKYHSRDLITSDSAEHRTFVAANTIFRWSVDTRVITATDLVDLAESWKSPLTTRTVVSLSYNKSWLNPNFSAIWISAYNALRECKKDQDQFKILFSISSVAYGSEDQSHIIPTLLAFAVEPANFCTENPPTDLQSNLKYDLSVGSQPTWQSISRLVKSYAHEFCFSPESRIPARQGERLPALEKRQRDLYKDRLHVDANHVFDRVVGAWPASPPTISLDSDAYDLNHLNSRIRRLYESCSRNIQLRQHLAHVSDIFRVLRARSRPSVPPVDESRYTFDPIFKAQFRMPPSVTLDQLVFTRRPPPVQPCDPHPYFGVAELTPPSGLDALQRLVCTVQRGSNDAFQRQYASDLESSVRHLCDDLSRAPALQVIKEEPSGKEIALLVDFYILCRDAVAEEVACVKEILGPKGQSDLCLKQSGQWPLITTDMLFRCLSSTSPIRLGKAWKKYVVHLALLLLELQRARRLLLFALNGHHDEFYKELENVGCDGWDPTQHLDWILIQLQGNFLIRRVQVDVANEMISPVLKANTALQLNMGEGKSSVIIPIAVAELADGDQLVRIVVPKSLTNQTFQVLDNRLGGFVNRPIYYLAFSRCLSLNPRQINTLQSLMTECVRKRGVMVVQPDHVLSLKLVTIEKQISSDKVIASPLLNLQRWLHSVARDILDESDEILHVRYQLVYTIGCQQPMEGFPGRWTTTQQVLATAKKHAMSLRTTFEEGIECESGPSGSFPHIRILQPEAAEALVSNIACDALDGLLPDLNFHQLNSRVRNATLKFLTERDVSPLTSKTVEKYAQQSSLWEGLLLLRGLLAMDILLFAFQNQRWRVDYGLAPKRTMLAVPYRAKDVPAPKAEFGHPDVAIILTCLSYYYGGLTEDQLQFSFQLLLSQDDPSIGYDLWVQDCDAVPNPLRNHTGINLKSSEQWIAHIVPLFSRNHVTINFFLARVVFPKEAKEFPSKLSCSGWDLAERKGRFVTGFSGTNDGQYLLPLHITQRDPDHQRGTNAKVLSYLLQPENNHYMCISHENGKRRTTHESLEILVAQTPEIRVLLDVGAQMLDLQNHELAKAWLHVFRKASAAIYFNEDDELKVLTRDGRTHLLISSPFAQQLDQCVIYLDDAHTRGTDIRFPIGFRAAVTLGPSVTKDRLAQGCMRMRKLGHSHSLMFFAPLEIDRRIRSVANKGSLDDIETMDILHWTILETLNDIRQRATHWAQQGMDHQTRYRAWSEFCAGELAPEQLTTQWLQPEVKSLVKLYAPHDASRSINITIPEIREHCIRLGITSLHEGGMGEEQEREVIHEVEREREVERPPRARPANHSLSKEVVNFVKTGVIPNHSPVFQSIFTTLGNTSAVTNESHIWNRWMLATEDFRQTIVPSEGDKASSKVDEFLRPVQWIVSSQTAVKQVLVILSPHEVDRLLPHIRRSDHVHLHLYTPRTTKSMKPSDGLDLYSIPTVPPDWRPPQALMRQLNVFAGQLYLSNHAEYIRLCQFLCVYTGLQEDEEEMVVECDGFVMPEHRHGSPSRQQRTFQSTPLPFVKVLLGLRRKGMSFGQTHMGKILDGRVLAERDFDSAEADLEVR